MAPKHNIRPSGAHATLIAFIAVISVVAFMTATVSAQCDCTGGKVLSYGAYCYPNWYTNSYVVLPLSSYRYTIYCQRRGPCVRANCWWNQIYYRGSYCYVSDYYLTTGCIGKCSSRPLC